ncbi:MAG: shikimate dehydrogenase [Crocinitomicaceae bacterium]|nr:shikimate dehydrogenase [Crocinitomicaceae bacterium]
MKTYGLIGRSLGHSFSKSFFEYYFRENAIDASYQNYELETIDQVVDLFQKDIHGFNVTIPYKEAIIPFLDELSDEAKAIGAVNVVQVVNGKRVGHNTDAFGFHQSIKPFLTNRHERAIIFGTGGASKAVEYVLKNIGVDVIFISRDPRGSNQFHYNEVNHHMLQACKLLVNTTPVGTFPNINDFLDIPYSHLSHEHLAVDLIYNPEKTKFLEYAESEGAMILNGKSMLREQALKSWKIWIGE